MASRMKADLSAGTTLEPSSKKKHAIRRRILSGHVGFVTQSISTSVLNSTDCYSSSVVCIPLIYGLASTYGHCVSHPL